MDATGSSPRRTSPRTMCRTAASECSFVRAMSPSYNARTRGQSVFDAVEEDRLFTFRRIAKGNDANEARPCRSPGQASIAPRVPPGTRHWRDGHATWALASASPNDIGNNEAWNTRRLAALCGSGPAERHTRRLPGARVRPGAAARCSTCGIARLQRVALELEFTRARKRAKIAAALRVQRRISLRPLRATGQQ